MSDEEFVQRLEAFVKKCRPAGDGSCTLSWRPYGGDAGQTAEGYLRAREYGGGSEFHEWPSPEQREKAIATDSMWELEVTNAIGWSDNYAAADLSELIKLAGV